MTKIPTKKITEYTRGQQPEIVSFLIKIANMETPTEVAQAQKPIMDELRCQFESLDMKVFFMPGSQRGGYLMARPVNRTKHQPIQLMIGHCDTVWPIDTLKSMPVISDNGSLKGPGVFDMKSGISQMIFALKAIKELDLMPPFTPVVLINSDEEKGSHESKSAIIRLAKIAKRAFVLEPPIGLEGKLKTVRKGIGRFTLEIKGKSAHAGLDPGKGASAILELSYQVQELFKLNDIAKGITVNVGLIEGGIGPNVMAPSAKAVIDVRVLTHADGDRITKQILALKAINPDTELFIDGGIGRPPMETSQRNRNLWKKAKKMGTKMGLELQQATVGGASDGNTVSQYTATLDGLGTNGDGAHAAHEFVLEDKLTERTALLTHLLLMT